MTFNLAFNISYPNKYLDLMKVARAAQEGWGGMTNLQLMAAGWLDANGWPKKLAGAYPPPLDVIRIIWDDVNTIKTGDWVVTWEGNGTIYIGNVGSLDNSVARRWTFTGPADNSIFWLDIVTTDDAPTNVRNIKVFRPENEDRVEAGEQFTPEYLAAIRNGCVFPVGRYMTILNPNGFSYPHPVDWADSLPLNYQTWQGHPYGIPPAALIELANLTGVEPWFTLPHTVSDDYVEGFAELCLANLNAPLRPWVEYSNETWNANIGAQYEYGNAMGNAALWTTGGGDSFTNGEQWKGYRPAQISGIMREVYGTDSGDGWVGVLGTFPTLAYSTEHRLFGVDYYLSNEAPPDTTTSQLFTYLAGSGYYGNNIMGDQTNVDVLIAYLETHTLEQTTDWVAAKLVDPSYSSSIPSYAALWEDQSDLAEARGLTLCAYEAGQHIFYNAGATISPTNMALIDTFMRYFMVSLQFGGLSDINVDAWEAVTEGPFLHYTMIDVWGSNGSWGLIETVISSTNYGQSAYMTRGRGLDYIEGGKAVTTRYA